MPADPLATSDLTGLILAAPCPVVLLDTAVFLDILRVPYRNKIPDDTVASVVTLVKHSQAQPRGVWLVTTGNVLTELGANRQEVASELARELDHLQEGIRRLEKVTADLFPERKFPTTAMLHSGLASRVEGLLDGLLGAVTGFTGSSSCTNNAGMRVRTASPPSSKGKQEFKDCEIFEEFLELMHALRQREFTQPAVFVTPNSRDYGPAPAGHPRIQTDLDACAVQYVSSLSWARHWLESGKP